MTDDQYLRACGWDMHADGSASKRWGECQPVMCYPIAEAVEIQLSADRERFAFVLARTPQPGSRNCDSGFGVDVPWWSGLVKS